MNHSFDIKVAEKYGVHAAIILNNLEHWIAKNKANNQNYFESNYWTYNSKKAFVELFPYMTARQIEYALKKLIDDGVVITGNFNKMAYDRTLWYAITKKGYCILQNCEMEETKLLNENDKIVEPIPNINADINNTNINSNINTNTSNNVGVELLTFEEVAFNQFWSIYPKKINKKGCFKTFKNIKHLKTELPLILEAVERLKKTKAWIKDNGQYIPYPQTFLNQERWKDVQEETLADKITNIDMTGWL